MRNVTLISSKDHLIYVILADKNGEELTITDVTMANGSSSGGTFIHSGIGFGVEGSANTFYYKNSAWEHHEEFIAPYVNTQYNSNTSTSFLFGAVATSNNTLYVGVIPKEDSVSSSLANLTEEIANTAEMGQLQQNTNTAFQLFKICQFDINRDVNTFEKLETIEETISDSDIEII
jgi:hypothetical protein